MNGDLSEMYIRALNPHAVFSGSQARPMEQRVDTPLMPQAQPVPSNAGSAFNGWPNIFAQSPWLKNMTTLGTGATFNPGYMPDM